MSYKFLLLVALTTVSREASACRIYCRDAETNKYSCCDSEKPVYQSEQSSLPGNCYYYCAYEGSIYCCGESSVPIPSSHEPHEGRCPEEGEQICKSQGIFYYTKKGKTGRTSGSLILAEKDGKQQPPCASDGYCAQEEKCCPSKCARKHICLKSLPSEEEEK